MKQRGTSPGIWIRPLLTSAAVPASWLIQAKRPYAWVGRGQILDPSVPAVIDLVRADVGRLVDDWGFELVKHDFTTYDTLSFWGSGIGGNAPADGWALADRTRTSAEIISDPYPVIREAAGSALVLGCNTIGHLAAGLCEIQRTGDNTSGVEWERTRRMGINTLAMRMPQHDAFFAVDADCVGLTNAVPWSFNRQWLKLLAASGTPLFVSAHPDVLGAEQRAAVRAAFARAAQVQPVAGSRAVGLADHRQPGALALRRRRTAFRLDRRCRGSAVLS